LIGKPEGRSPFRRPKCRWKYNIEMNLEELRLDGMEWIHLAHYRDQWRLL
jgi:hypothetical protein